MGKTATAKETISAREGRAFIDGEEILNLVKFELNVEKEKTELKVAGKKATGHKTIGYSVTGTITECKRTSKWIQLMKKYKDTGVDVYFTLVGIHEDKASGRGTEKVVAYECNIDSVQLAGIDAEGDIVKVEIPFTAEDWDLEEALKND